MREDEIDLVVVGAGLAGLTAGAVAARAGRSVTILDGRRPGGRASTDVRDGFRLNQGAHALYRSSAGRAVLGRLGITPRGEAPSTRTMTGWRDGSLGTLTAGAVGLLRTSLLSAPSKVAIGRLLAGLTRLVPEAHVQQSAAGWLDSLELRTDAAQLVEALIHVTSYANSLTDISADAAIRQLQMGLNTGVDYLDGGWEQLVAALDATATAAGARLQTGAAVLAIEAGGDRWLVRTSEREWRAGAVVVAAGGPASSAALLPVDPGWGELGPDQTAACLDLGLRKPPEHRFILGLGEPLYLSVHGPPADLAPAGQSVVHVMRYGARTSGEDRPRLEALATAAGVGQADVVVERFLHRMVVAHAAPRPGVGLAGRPAVTVDGAPGVYVAGDWVGPVGLLSDASFASGEAAANAALAHVMKVAAG